MSQLRHKAVEVTKLCSSSISKPWPDPPSSLPWSPPSLQSDQADSSKSLIRHQLLLCNELLYEVQYIHILWHNNASLYIDIHRRTREALIPVAYIHGFYRCSMCQFSGVCTATPRRLYCALRVPTTLLRRPWRPYGDHSASWLRSPKLGDYFEHVQSSRRWPATLATPRRLSASLSRPRGDHGDPAASWVAVGSL